MIELIATWPSWAAWALLVLLAYGSIVGVYALLGAAGLIMIVPVIMVAANILVLRQVDLPFLADPVAMGTEVFVALFLVFDLLNERAGPRAARAGVLAGFVGYGLFTLWIITGIAIAPVDPALTGADGAWAAANHQAMQALFTPAPVFLVAGLIAYGASSLSDIWLFSWLRRVTGGRHLWLRTLTSTAISTLIDNTVFSLLAFRLLAAQPVAWDTLLATYILGTLVLRWALALLETPFLYLARLVRRPLLDVTAPA